MDCPKILGLGTILAVAAWGGATFREHDGECPPNLPPNAQSVQIQIVAANTTTTTPPSMIYLRPRNA